VAIAKGDLFALPEHIAPYLSSVLRHLPQESYHIDWTRLGPARNIEISQAAQRGREQPMRESLSELVIERDQ
jgi:hypothetical protein